METKKFQGLKITCVKERLTTYRLQMNDNSILDIPRIELGSFVPQKGMFVRYRFYRGLILQKVEFDGKLVVNRTPLDIMRLLFLLDDKLEEDVRKDNSQETDPVYAKLSKLMKARISMLLELSKHSSQGEFPNDAIDYEVARCSLAEALGNIGLPYLQKFRTLSIVSQKSILMCDIDAEFIEDIIILAEAYAKDVAGQTPLAEAETLKVWSCILDISKEEFNNFRKKYFKP